MCVAEQRGETGEKKKYRNCRPTIVCRIVGVCGVVFRADHSDDDSHSIIHAHIHTRRGRAHLGTHTHTHIHTCTKGGLTAS